MVALAIGPSSIGRHLRQLLHDLDHDEFAVRQESSRQLAYLGERVEADLVGALKANPSAEVSWRLRRLLKQLRQGQRPPDALRELRAMMVLERSGTAPARKLLAGLAGGADGAWMTGLARDALLRLGQRGGR